MGSSPSNFEKTNLVIRRRMEACYPWMFWKSWLINSCDWFNPLPLDEKLACSIMVKLQSRSSKEVVLASIKFLISLREVERFSSHIKLFRYSICYASLSIFKDRQLSNIKTCLFLEIEKVYGCYISKRWK